MVDWHKPNLDPETIAKIIREGREENDKKFESYAKYVEFIVNDNEEILSNIGSDYDDNGVPYWDKYKNKSRVEIMSNRDVKEILDDIRYSEELLAMEDLSNAMKDYMRYTDELIVSLQAYIDYLLVEDPL